MTAARKRAAGITLDLAPELQRLILTPELLHQNLVLLLPQWRRQEPIPRLLLEELLLLPLV